MSLTSKSESNVFPADTAGRCASRSASLVLCGLLAACASALPQEPEPQPGLPFDANAAIAAIDAAGGAAETELVVSPISDPQVEDLREQAREARLQQDYPVAVAALDQAMQLNPDDPAILQERAEVALLVQDPETALQLARRAIEIGTQVGPLCRRHWETVAQVNAVDADDPTAAAVVVEAHRQRDACTISAPPRY